MAFEHLSEKNVEELDCEIETGNMRKIEAALFLSGRFMTIQELITITDVNPILLKKMLSDLQDKYKNSGINIIKNENTWKMDVAEDFLEMVNRLATGSSEFTKAEQETLAMIAYKQPMKQSVVIKIRGNKAYDHIKRFVEIGLLHKKKMGHTSELTLTEKFYEYFHLTKGDQLPNLEVKNEPNNN
ncbi:MAG: SMC-Scp complex subunit ScpB [archaeon]